MEELLNNAVLVATILAPLTTGLIQVVKQTVNVDKQYLPALSLIVAVLIAVLLAVATGQDLVQYVLVGLVGGLSASGLYDQFNVKELEQ